MALAYLLSYGGVPFVSDRARAFPMRPLQDAELTNDGIRKQQPEIDLWDEINRLIPKKFLQDYVLPSNYPGRNLGAIARQWQIGPSPMPTEISVGEWFYPNGASRWGIFRGLATSKMVKAMLEVTNGSDPATFIMQAEPTGLSNPNNNPNNFHLSTSMYMLPPRPLAEQGGGLDGIYLVTLVDERYYWQFNPVSLRVGPSTTWQDLITQIATALNVTMTFSAIAAAYSTPEPDSQFWCNQESAALLLDAVAYNIGCTVVRNLDGTYNLQTPTESQVIVDANRGNVLQVVRIAGGDIFSDGNTILPVGDLTPSKNSVLPESVAVTFPKYVTGNDPVPHYYNTRYAVPRPTSWYEESYGDVYTISVPLANGGDGVAGLVGVAGAIHTIHTTAKAAYDTEAAATGDPTNVVVLTTLATQLAQDYFNNQIASALDEVYPGTVVWVPEGIHDIVWTYSEKMRQSSTRVLRSEWNQIIREMQHAAPGLNAIGAGGRSVAQTWKDASGNVQYGVNLVTATSGLFISSGVRTDGGIQEVILGGGSTTPTSGSINSGNLSVINWPITFNSYFNWTYATVNLGGTYNDYTLSDISKLRIVANTTTTINGITNGTSGRMLVVWNVGPNRVILKNQNAAAAANTVITPIQNDYTIWPNDGVILEYDGTSGMWRFDHPTFAGGDTASGARTYGLRHLKFGTGLNYTDVTDGTAVVTLGSGAIGSGYIVSGALGSGNLSEIDWDIAFNNRTTFNGPLSLSYTATSISGIRNNYSISGTSKLRLNPVVSGTSITGFAGGTAGQILVVWNTTTSGLSGCIPLTIKNDSTLSSGNNRVITPLHVDYNLWPDDGCILEYDAVSGVWRFDVPTFAGGDSTSGVRTYALRNLKAGDGITYTDNGDGSAVIANASGSARGGNEADWSYYRNATGPWPITPANEFKSGLAELYYLGGALPNQPLVVGIVNEKVLTAVPFISPRGGTIDRIAFDLRISGTSGNTVNLGIYDTAAANDLYPTGLLGSYSVSSGITMTGLKAVDASGFLFSEGKLYWFAMVTASGTTVTCSQFDIANANNVPSNLICVLGYTTSSGFGFQRPGLGLHYTLPSGAIGDLPSSFYSKDTSGVVILTEAAVPAGPYPAIGVRYLT